MSITAVSGATTLLDGIHKRFQEGFGELFAGYLQAQTPGNSSSNTSGITISSLGGSGVSASDTVNGAIKDFLEYMQKPPAERMLEAWLKSHGISKEQFDAMSPDEQKALLAKMEQEIKQKLAEKAEKGENLTSALLE